LSGNNAIKVITKKTFCHLEDPGLPVVRHNRDSWVIAFQQNRKLLIGQRAVYPQMERKNSWREIERSTFKEQTPVTSRLRMQTLL